MTIFTSSTMVAGKTASDIATLEEFGDNEKYINTQRTKARTSAATEEIQFDELGSNQNSKGLVTSIMDRVKAGDKEKTLQSLKDFGMIEEDATLSNYQDKVTSGEEFLVGKAKASAAAMNKHDRLAVGDYSVNTTTNLSTRETRAEATKVNSTTVGDSYTDSNGVEIKNPVQSALKAMGIDTTDAFLKDNNIEFGGFNKDGSPMFTSNGQEVSATDIAGMIAGHSVEAAKVATVGYGVNKASALVPGMSGETLFQKVENGFDNLVGGKSSSQSFNSATNSTQNNNTDNTQNDIFKHDETPSSRNFAGQPTNSHPSNNKSIISNIGNKVNKYGSEVLDNVKSGIVSL